MGLWLKFVLVYTTSYFLAPNTSCTPSLPITFILPSNRYRNLFELIYIIPSIFITTSKLCTLCDLKGACTPLPHSKYAYGPALPKESAPTTLLGLQSRQKGEASLLVSASLLFRSFIFGAAPLRPFSKAESIRLTDGPYKLILLFCVNFVGLRPS